MSNLTIINNSKPTLPTQTYCYSGRWSCEDSFHDCPGKCGYVRYYDENGIEQMEAGFCIDDGIVQIIASSIIEATGMKQVTCESDPIETLNTHSDTCGSCWTIRINVPSGENRDVVFSSNFQGGALYGFSGTACQESPDPTYNIFNDQTINITETKEFYFGIDASRNSGTNPYASNIYVEVLNSGVSLQSISYNRTHTNAKC